MLKKSQSTLFFLLLLFVTLLLPMNLAGANAAHQLFITTEPVELEEGIVVDEGVHFYGETTENGLSLQFGQETIEIDKAVAIETEDEALEFRTTEDASQVGDELTAGTELIAAHDETTKLTVTKTIAYPVHSNDVAEEVVYFGNQVFIVVDANEESEVAEANVAQAEVGTEEETERGKQEAEQAHTKEQEDAANETEALETMSVAAAATKQVNPWQGVSSNYFRVTTEDLPVYDNRTGELIQVGTLEKGRDYKRVSDYGNWHRIQFGDIDGYVWKNSTIPSSNENINNENTSYRNTSATFQPKEDITVYDNTSGSLVPFGTIEAGVDYAIASDYGNWWRVIYSDMVGYVLKSGVTTGSDKPEVKPDRVNRNYFRAKTDVPVYDNRTGALVEVGKLTAGKEYKRVGDYGKNWHRIQFGDISGYVLKSQTEATSGSSIRNENKNYRNNGQKFTTGQEVTVFDNTSGSLVPFGTIGSGVEYTIASDYGNWWRIIYSDMVGYVLKSSISKPAATPAPAPKPTPEPETKPEQVDSNYFRALTDASVYDNRTGSLVRVGKLRAGQEYKRIEDYGNWHRIQFRDQYGYVLKSQTEPTSGNSIQNENKNYANNGSSFTTLQDVTVYDNSGSGGLKPFGSIDKGTTYTIASDYGNWWRIIYSDMVGFVRKSEVELNGVKIFLDPGHGAHDPGGRGHGLNEKDMVLDIANKTANILRSNYQDVEVMMSRTDDTFIPLLDRSRMANNWGADYFVSFHLNALNGSARGFETFIYNGGVSQETVDRQRDIHTYLIQRMDGIPDRGMKRANFSVLRNSAMPAILLEYLFIDNRAENNKVRSASYRTHLAQITADAIAQSYNLMRK